MTIKSTIAKNIHGSIPNNNNVKTPLESMEQQFQGSDNALATTLMANLSSMTCDVSYWCMGATHGDEG